MESFLIFKRLTVFSRYFLHEKHKEAWGSAFHLSEGITDGI